MKVDNYATYPRDLITCSIHLQHINIHLQIWRHVTCIGDMSAVASVDEASHNFKPMHSGKLDSTQLNCAEFPLRIGLISRTRHTQTRKRFYTFCPTFQIFPISVPRLLKAQTCKLIEK